MFVIVAVSYIEIMLFLPVNWFEWLYVVNFYLFFLVFVIGNYNDKCIT